MAVSVGAVAFAVPGSAFRKLGDPWPAGVVPYYNAAYDQAWAVNQAVNAWNTSGARVRFVPVSRGSAKLVIEHATVRSMHPGGSNRWLSVSQRGEDLELAPRLGFVLARLGGWGDGARAGPHSGADT